jgi:iron complex outermembrane receptor protein
MAAQVPQSFRNRRSWFTKPFHLHQVRLIFRVVLSMSALCLLEIDLPSALAQPESERSVPSDKSAETPAGESSAEPETQPISELELLKEEKSLALEEESVSIAREMYPGKTQPISQAPASVYVITDEDIRHSGAIDLPTVLRRIPGMEVMQMTGADFNVSTRGNNQTLANKLLVLVDGRSIYEDIQGQVWWKAIPVTLPEIKRIEVLKGPASVLYGFNAFDGVINIVTKSAREMKGTTLQFGGGEFGTISAAGIQAGTYKNLGYRLSLGRDQTNQWNNRDALAFRNNKFEGQVEYQPGGASKLTISGGLFDVNRFDGPVLQDRGNFIHAASTVVNGHANVLYERPNFFIRAWWQMWDHNQTNNVNPLISPFIAVIDRNGNPTINLVQNSYNLESQHAIDFGAANRLTYGFNYRHNTGSSSFLTQFTREDRLGFYIQDEWHLTQALTAVAGLRYDMDTFINPTYSPRGALLYKLNENHTLRLSASVGYRPPTMFEVGADARSLIFFPGIPPFVPPSVIPGSLTGSNNLNPEKISSYELGYQGWYLKHRLRVRGDLFFNHISDLITEQLVSPTSRNLVAVNSPGVADIHGLEAGVEFLVTTWLSGYANYTYQEIGQTIAINDVRRGAPRNKVNAGLRAEWSNGFNANVDYHYVSSATYPVSSVFASFAVFPFNGPPPPNSTVGSYNLLNVRGGYRFWHDKAEVAIAAFNALNDKHKEHPLGDLIGSRVMGWLTIYY